MYMINYLLFDVDNTLYRASWGLDKTFNDAITKYVAQYLNITTEEALALRKIQSPKYGTTLAWLRIEKGFKDIESFFQAIHPQDVSPYLKKDTKLREMLLRLPQKKAVLTNAPIEHADRVLSYLEIKDCFAHLFDIKYFKYLGKPNLKTYQTTLKTAGFELSQTLFIDDHPKYLYPFKKMGGQVLLIDEEGIHAEKEDLPKIESIMELETYLESVN